MHNSNAYGAQYQRAADDPFSTNHFSTNQPHGSSVSSWKTEGGAKSAEELNPIADFIEDQVSKASCCKLSGGM